MAALRPCPSGPVVVVAASQLSRSSASSSCIVRPFGRRLSASLLNLRTSTARRGHRHATGAWKGTGAWEGAGDVQRPDDEERLTEEQAYIFHEKLIKEHYEVEKFPKDMPFREDIEKIYSYEKAIASWNSSIFYIEATAFSLYLCMIATKGVKLASRVMDSAALRPDKQDEISSCTTKQTLTMYVSIFVKLAKDTCDRKFNDQSILSLLCAFKGVAAVGHILLQDALTNVDYDGYSDSLVLDTDDSWHEYRKNLSNLQDEFRAVSKSTKAYEILKPTMVHTMTLNMAFILDVVARHERLLGIKGWRRPIKASGDGEPSA